MVPYLRERVVDAATMLRASTEQTALLEDVAEAHEDFLSQMREMSRLVTDLEDRVTGRTDRRTARAGRRRPTTWWWSTTTRRRCPGWRRCCPRNKAGASSRL